jgi:cyclophilin family peptidyl-prolyl cis-trans isomerase
MQQKTTMASIENEAKNGLKNIKYSIAMARTTAPNSASSQFFINVADNDFLNYPGQDGWGYCVFGKVISGQEVVDKIQIVETINLGGHADVPANPIVINKAFIKE